MSGIPILPRFMKPKKKTKPAPLTRRQSFNGDVKAPGQPPSPLIQQISRKKERLEEPPGVPLHAKSASLSSLLVNNEEAAATGMNGLTELCSGSSSVPLDRQSIIDIQKDIQPFTVATTKLRDTISKVKTGDDEMRLKLQPVVVNCIEDLSRVVNNISATYPEVSSICIKSSLATLTESSKSWKQTTQDIVTWCRHCEDALNTLLDAFTKSVEGYMADSLPDTHVQQMSGSNTNIPRAFTSPTASFKGSSNMMKGHYSKSAENLSAYQYHEMQQDRELTADIDKALLCTENAVEVALENSKTRSKYIREITNYMNKRAQIVADYDRQMSKLNKSVRDVLPDLATESGESLPLLGVFQQCLDEDVNFARMNNKTFNLHVTQKLVEPMEKRNSECIKRKKELKEMWSREQKKLSDCKSALKATKSKYTMLGQDLAKLKAIQMQKDEVGHKQEKRKKEITDLEAKRIEAETAYKQAVANANDCQYQVVEISQKSILCAFRRMVMELDQILKDSFESHFDLQHHFFDQFPQRFMALQDQVENFEPGRDFYHHVIRQPQLKDEPIEFVFEEFDPDADLQVFKAAASASDLVEHDGVEFHASVDSGLHSCDTESPMFGRRLGSPVSAWESYQVPIHSSHSPQHSTASSSNVSVTATPTISPGVSVEIQSLSSQQQQQQQPLSNSQPPNSKATRRLGTKRTSRPVSMANVFDHANDTASTNSSSAQRRVSATADIQETSSVKSLSMSMSDFNNAVMSKSARTHRFKKADDPNRCRECDNNVYFHGVECEVCGLTCHQKCLEFLMIKCGNKKLRRRIRTFNVDFRKHLEVTHCNIPIIVTKCINELDERGLNAKGIYRLSGAKTKMEKLCRLFEVGGDRVDISDQSPHQIASCLKLYFRQLPEPLLTYALYDSFIACAKDAGKILPVGDEQVGEEVKELERSMISCLHELLMQLDAQRYLTLARLLFHLHRVHQHHRFNCMPASNLGIVFGPNLLQPEETQSSFMAIKEMTYQAKVVELLIHYAHDVLNITEDKVREEENAEDDVGTVEAYIPIEQYSECSYGTADEKMETRTTISDALDLDDDSSNYKLFDGNMEELLHSLYHSARQRLGDEMPLVSKSKSVSPDNEDSEEDSLVLPGSVGSESESLLSLQTPRSSLPPVEERLEHRMPEFKDDVWEKDNSHNAMHHGVPKCRFPLSSMHSRSTPHLFVDIDNSHLQNKSRSSVPSIGMDTETESGFGSNKGISEQSLNNSTDFEDSQTDSDPDFDDDNDVLSLPDGSVMSPTNESTRSTPRKSGALSVTARQRKSSSFKRDWPGRQVIAKRAVSLHIPRNKDNVSTRKPLYKSDSNYLSSSLSQLQHYDESSPSPVSLDRYTMGAASSHSDRAYNSETNSPWSTPLHRMKHDPACGVTHFHDEDCNHMISVSVPDNHISDDALLCNNHHHTLSTNDNTVTNDRLHRLSTLVSEDLPEGEEKAAREQNTTENDKEMALEHQIRREFKKVDSIGENLCNNLYSDVDTGNPFSHQSPTSEDGISIHEVKLDVRSLSPLSENSVEDGPCGKNMPYHSSSNSTSSAEMHFIHKQHDSTASEQSMDSQNKPINYDQLALHSSLPDRIPPSPQRYRRLLAITPSLQKLSLSRSTSDVSNNVKNKEKHASASPKGSGFKFSLKRKNSLVLPDDRENTSRALSLSRDKSKSTNELYTAKEKSWTTSIFSGLPMFRKTKSNGRSKQHDVITSSGSPKSKRKKSRAPQYV